MQKTVGRLEKWSNVRSSAIFIDREKDGQPTYRVQRMLPYGKSLEDVMFFSANNYDPFEQSRGMHGSVQFTGVELGKRLARANLVLGWFNSNLEEIRRQYPTMEARNVLLQEMEAAIAARTTGRPLPRPYKIPDRRHGMEWLDQPI